MDNFWIILGQNSGQLQVILNIVAIILAVFAAKYAKKQIQQTQNQMKENNRVLAYNLKLEILKNAYECRNEIYEIEHKYKKLKENFRLQLQNRGLALGSNLEGYDISIGEYLDVMLDLLKKPKEVIDNMIETLSKSDCDLSNETLECYLQHIVNTRGTIASSSDGIDRRIEDIQQYV